MADNSRALNGSSDHISKADPTGVTLNAAWSWGAWVNPDNNSLRALMRMGAASNAEPKVQPYLNTVIVVRIAGTNVAGGSTTIATGTWWRLGVTKAAAGTSLIKTIVNGSEEGSENADAPTALAAGDVFSVGRGATDIGIDWLDGKTAWQFWLQGVVLSAAALDGYLNDPQSLVDDYGPSGGVTANALKIYWPCQCDNATEEDQSGVGNDGTYTGTTLGSGDGPSPSTPWNPCTATAALTGTITASATEADIVAGGKTIILTLTGDTWIPA